MGLFRVGWGGTVWCSLGSGEGDRDAEEIWVLGEGFRSKGNDDVGRGERLMRCRYML